MSNVNINLIFENKIKKFDIKNITDSIKYLDLLIFNMKNNSNNFDISLSFCNKKIINIITQLKRTMNLSLYYTEIKKWQENIIIKKEEIIKIYKNDIFDDDKKIFKMKFNDKIIEKENIESERNFENFIINIDYIINFNNNSLQNSLISINSTKFQKSKIKIIIFVISIISLIVFIIILLVILI